MADSKLTWGCCKLGKEEDEYILCTKCQKKYHGTCLSTEVAEEEVFVCPLCTNSKPRSRRLDNAPINTKMSVKTIDTSKRPKKRLPVDSPELCTQETTSMTQDDVRNIIQAEMKSLLSELNKSMATMFNSELKSIKDEIKDVKESMTFMSNQYEDFISIQKNTTEDITMLKRQNDELNTKVNDLTYKMNAMEQNARANNIEIQCLPEINSENVVNLVEKIGEVVNCKISDREILHCTRVAKMNRNSARPRSIVTQLSSPKLRDELLAAVINFNKSNPHDKLNTSHIGIKGDKKPVFVVEHLSSANKAIHSAARLKAKELGYKFVWVRKGRVYMRKDDTSEYRFIKDIETLDKLKA